MSSPPPPPLLLPPLRERDVDPDPVCQFAAWFAEATRAGVPQPEAAALATADASGAPSVRMVLVKRADDHGFVFFTNYESRKGRELAANPRAALAFYWGGLGRQVRVVGTVARTSREESESYAHSRPRGSRLSALASAQSATIDGRESLERRVEELSQRYADAAQLPVSDSWGGFRLTPQTLELWQQRADRLHDRLLYTRSREGGWRLTRLSP